LSIRIYGATNIAIQVEYDETARKSSRVPKLRLMKSEQDKAKEGVSKMKGRVCRAIGAVIFAVMWLGQAAAQETVEVLDPISVSANTAEKPQSKVWLHADTWWAVAPSTSVSPSGTWIWRLESDHS